jgi:hypothetical protein
MRSRALDEDLRRLYADDQTLLWNAFGVVGRVEVRILSVLHPGVRRNVLSARRHSRHHFRVPISMNCLARTCCISLSKEPSRITLSNGCKTGSFSILERS